ncbi:MAG: hypothetical protein AAGB93_18545 [Planctomycetota bacterium]
MNSRLLLLFVGLLAASTTIALTTTRSDVDLIVRTAAGGEVEGRTRLRLEVEERDVTFHVDGAPGTEAGRRRAFLVTRDMRWTDSIGEVEGGRVLAFERTFGDLVGGSTLAGLGETFREPTGTSPLDGATVTFDWNERERRYDAELREAPDVATEDEERVLETLTPIADFSGLLPGAPVEVDATWEAEPAALGAALAPLGFVEIDLEGQRLVALGSYTGFTAPGLPPIPERWWGAPTFDAWLEDGCVDVTLGAVESRGGRRVARLDVEAEVRARGDVGPWLARYRGPRVEIEVERLAIETRLEGEGTLEWDVDAGRAIAWSFEGAIELELDAKWALQERNRYELDAVRRMEGRLETSATLAAE